MVVVSGDAGVGDVPKHEVLVVALATYNLASWYTEKSLQELSVIEQGVIVLSATVGNA